MSACTLLHTWYVREYLRGLYFIAEVPVSRELTRRHLDEDDDNDDASSRERMTKSSRESHRVFVDH